MFFILMTVFSLVFSDVIIEDSIPTTNKIEDTSSSSFIVSRDPFFRELDQFIVEGKKTSPVDLDLSELNLVGIVSGIKMPIAMFKGPYNSRYLLKRGEAIGRRGGVIKSIKINKVVIVEKTKDVDGHITERTIIKSLGKN